MPENQSCRVVSSWEMFVFLDPRKMLIWWKSMVMCEIIVDGVGQ